MDEKTTISYCVTVCDELIELTTLLNFLQLHIRDVDEIVIQYDSENVTEEVKEYLNVMDKIHSNHKVIEFPLNNDFSSFKNNLIHQCSKDYIFQIDADEIPHENLISYLPEVLEKNPVDLVFVPRINTVDGLTADHIKKWGWNVDENDWINFPDFQTRIFRRTDDVQFMNKVHERITGYTTFSNFPAKEEWCLYHHKNITKQEAQNKYYDTL